MLKGSKALDPKRLPKGLLDIESQEDFSEDNIKSQCIGKLFDDILSEDRKTSPKTKLGWKIRRIKDAYHDFRYSRRNRRVWRKTLDEIRP